MNSDSHTEKLYDTWSGYREWKARRSHAIMAWCGVVIFPAFGLLDYLMLDQWVLFLTVRCIAALFIVGVMLAAKNFDLSSDAIAHLSSQTIIQVLMWMLSQMNTPNQFFVYSLNTQTAFIASAIFLIWHPKNSIFLAGSTLVGFLFFNVFLATLTTVDIITSGTLPLMTIVIMSQLFVNYRYNSTYHDFRVQSDLNQLNSKLQFKNQEVHEQNIEITKQKHDLEDLNELKDRLLMIISHDFKSPLQSLKGLIMLINDSDRVSPEEFRALMKGLKHRVDKTYDFLEGLLMWSKSQMKGYQIRQQPVDIHRLVEDSMSLLVSFADHKNISVINKVNPLHGAIGDEDTIRLVIRNLIANAIKFTPIAGSIHILSTDDGANLTISVKDNGIGMEQSELDQLFNAKNPFHKNGTKLEKGTGLGLMLCKDFVEKNNGHLSVQSIPGHGTTISFTIARDPHRASGETFQDLLKTINE